MYVLMLNIVTCLYKKNWIIYIDNVILTFISFYYFYRLFILFIFYFIIYFIHFKSGYNSMLIATC